MQQLITIFHLLIAILLVVLVLIQHGKGAEMGASFGGGASGTMFGSQGATPFLVKLTAGLAFIFFISSATLSFVVSKQVAAKQEGGLPFVSEPMKTVAPIPIAPELSKPQSETSIVTAALEVKKETVAKKTNIK